MSKHSIVRDEWWPIYLIEADDGYDTYEIPDELVERQKVCHAEFEAIQVLLEKITKENK